MGSTQRSYLMSSKCRKKFLENETAEEINCQLNSKKSRNFPRNVLIAGTF